MYQQRNSFNRPGWVFLVAAITSIWVSSEALAQCPSGNNSIASAVRGGPGRPQRGGVGSGGQATNALQMIQLVQQARQMMQVQPAGLRQPTLFNRKYTVTNSIQNNFKKSPASVKKAVTTSSKSRRSRLIARLKERRLAREQKKLALRSKKKK